MKVFLRVTCYVLFLSAVFFTSSFEAPLRKSLTPEIQQDTLANDVINTQQQQQQQQQQQNGNTASYIPPFLHNFYKQLSASDKYFETDPSMTVIKGYFDGTTADGTYVINFPPLNSNAFFNFTFERAEIRIWYKCYETDNRDNFYLELSSNQLGYKHRTKANCQLIDENNRPSQYGWSIFDVTELMLALQTNEQTKLTNPLTFFATTSSRLVAISKQVFSSKYSPTHLPLLALYNSHVMKHVEPRDVSMRYTPFNIEEDDHGEVHHRTVRQASISCNRVSKSMRVSDFLRLMRTPDFTYSFPPSFNFGYCHGYCPFRLINHHNGTTHAQIMNTIAQLHHKPRYAKCVPASYKNLLVLYSSIIDGLETTTIKAYRDATVGNCGCR